MMCGLCVGGRFTSASNWRLNAPLLGMRNWSNTWSKFIPNGVLLAQIVQPGPPVYLTNVFTGFASEFHTVSLLLAGTWDYAGSRGNPNFEPFPFGITVLPDH